VLGIPRRFGGPLGAEQAWLLAGELATLFDEIAFEEADLDLIETADPADFAASWLARLDGLVPDKLAVHWQITTKLLQAVVRDWNGWLQNQRLMDLGLARVRALIAQRRALEAAPPREKLIAAGIGAGGTIPAATALLRCIANLPNGALVLQGMAEPITPSLADAIRRAPSHPFAAGRGFRYLDGTRCAALAGGPCWHQPFAGRRSTTGSLCRCAVIARSHGNPRQARRTDHTGSRFGAACGGRTRTPWHHRR